MPITAKTADLLRHIRATQAKFNEQIDALEAELNQEATPGQQAKQALAAFGRLWQARYQAKYTFNRKVDPAHLKRLVRELGLDDLKVRITAYLQDADPFIVKNRHPLNLFVSRVNVYAPRQVTSTLLSREDALPVGCQHRPPCLSDQDHTRRRLRESKVAS